MSYVKSGLAIAIVSLFSLPGTTQAADTVSMKVDSSALSAPTRVDRFIVRYTDTSTSANRSAVQQNVSRAAAATVAQASTAATRMAPLGMTYRRALGRDAAVVQATRLLNAQDATALMTQIASDPNVAHVEPDLLLQPVRDVQTAAVTPFVPNDPLFSTSQWDYQPPDGTMTTVGRDTAAYANYGGANVAKAWSLADGTGITVAVIDTGITHHPDLDTSLADAGYDFITDKLVSGRSVDGRVSGGWDTGDWTTDDKYLTANGGCASSASDQSNSSWHGSHVAGTVAEITNNGVGTAGVAYNAKVLPVRVLGHCGGYTSDIVDAITWSSGGTVDGVPANTHPAQVINMSLGGSGACSADSATATAITAAIQRGTVVVAAAGNSNADAAGFTPASCPGVIVVGSVGITSRRAYYSNYGKTVAIAAPGGGVYPNDASYGDAVISAGVIFSALNRGLHEPGEPGYAGYAGTSQATPHVAGTVALVLSAMQQANLPTPTPIQIRRLLANTSARFNVTQDQLIGAGLLDAYAAVHAALTTDLSNPTVALTRAAPLVSQSGFQGESFIYTLVVPAGAKNLTLRTYGGTGDVSLYVGVGSAPAADGTGAAYISARVGNNESVTITKPVAGTYYMRVNGVATFDNLTVVGTYTAP